MEKYSLQSVKKNEFADFFKAALLIKDKAHLTKEGLQRIISIKSGMNRSRKS